MKDLNNYLCDGMNCIQMIKTDWELLQEALGKDYNIQIFINLIFKKLTEKLKNCGTIKCNKEREVFEAQIENIIRETFKEYPRGEKEFKKFEEKENLDKNDMEALLLEIHDPNLYNQSDYPFYKLFLIPSDIKEGLYKELQKISDYEKKYPILAYILNENNKGIFLLEYLYDFNNFSNEMINYCSFRISREDATKIKYKDTKINLNINRFKEIWTKIKPYIKQYSCNKVYPLDLNENSELCYFLNDYTEYNENGKYSKGICIAAAYEKFIGWQNKLIDFLEFNNKLNYYINYTPKQKNIQDVKENEILNFKEVNEKLMSIIYQNSRRDIFDNSGRINYYNYKNNLYDFDNIEKAIGKILFSEKFEKVRFNDNLKFVTYYLETFRGNNSSILSDFLEKYPQKKTSKKVEIMEFIDNEADNQFKNLITIISSFQYLFIHFLNKEKILKNYCINNEIKYIPYIKNSRLCERFFRKISLNINELYESYSFIERICFKNIFEFHYNKTEIKEIKERRKKIEKIKIKNIKNLFIKKIIKSFGKREFIDACCKFMSRYLIGKRNDMDINENSLLHYYLDRRDLWPIDLWKYKEEIKNDLEFIGKEKILLSQCYDLYMNMKGDIFN